MSLDRAITLSHRTTRSLANAPRRWQLQIRKRLPTSLRHLLRLGRHIVPRGQSSPALPAHLLTDCRVLVSRVDLIAHMSRGGRIAEVGTHKGDFARHILEVCEPKELHLIDLDLSFLDPVVRQEQRVSVHQGLSHEVLKSFPDAYFDWIYIDADHSHAGVVRDANAAASKVKPGGYIIFNDFAHMDPFLGAYGVHRAVVEFAIARAWQFSWLAYEPNALYDVALQRPLDD